MEGNGDWQIEVNQSTDSEGWIYASVFKYVLIHNSAATSGLKASAPYVKALTEPARAATPPSVCSASSLKCINFYRRFLHCTCYPQAL